MAKALLGAMLMITVPSFIALIWFHFDEAHAWLGLPFIVGLYASVILGVIVAFE